MLVNQGLLRALFARLSVADPHLIAPVPHGIGVSLWVGMAGLLLGMGLMRVWLRPPTPAACTPDFLQRHWRSLARCIDAMDGVGLILLKPNGRVLMCNALAKQVLGNASDDSSCTLEDVYTPDNPLFDEAQNPLAYDDLPFWQALQQARPIRGQVVGRTRPNGHQQWFAVNTIPLRAQDGRIEILIGSFWDITEQRDAQIEHQQRADIFQRLLEAIGSVFWLRDLQTGMLTYVSPAYRTVWGRELEPLLHDPKTLLDSLHPDDRALMQKAFVHPPTQPFEAEYRICRPDGEVRWISDRGFPVHNAHGDPNYLAGFSQDITEHHYTERHLQQIAERERAIIRILLQMRQTLDLDQIFRATTTELRQALNCSRVVIYQFQPDWSGAFVAESVAEGWRSLIQVFSQAPDETLSAVSNDRCVVRHLSDAEDLVEDTFLQETQGGAYTQGLSYLSVVDIYEPGFEDCYIQLLETFQARAYLTVPIFCNDKLWGLMASYQNDGPRHWDGNEIKLVTQIGAHLGIAIQQAELLETTQQQAQDLQIAKQAADAANRAKSQFLASMSHELRTPLNAILGFTDILRHDALLPDESQETLEIIDSSGQHLLSLINDILEMSRIEAGRLPVQSEPFDLTELLSGVEQMFSLPATQKGITLRVGCDRHIPKKLEADATKLRQILINLLGNALKFTEQGFVSVQVSHLPHEPESDIRPNDAPLWLEFAVQDTGVGISPDDRALLFEAFGQTESGQKAGGTGLGLSISLRYAQLMGGDIHVESTPRLGSCFRVRLPVQPQDLPDNQRSYPPIHVEDRLTMTAPDYRILIVEDSNTNRLLLIKLLQSLGYNNLQVAENGQLAVNLAQTWRPHLIWMDMQMPVMDGYEATRILRTQPDLAETTIIALTANVFDEQQKEILAAGCDAILRKPFRRDELAAMLQQYLPCPV